MKRQCLIEVNRAATERVILMEEMKLELLVTSSIRTHYSYTHVIYPQVDSEIRQDREAHSTVAMDRLEIAVSRRGQKDSRDHNDKNATYQRASDAATLIEESIAYVVCTSL